MRINSIIETNVPGVDISELIKKINAEISVFEETSKNMKIEIPEIEDLNFEYFNIENKLRNVDSDEYHINDLLEFNGITFIENAFLALLKREPFEFEKEEYLGLMIQHNLSKIEIIHRLRFSREGEKNGIRINGLEKSYNIRRIYETPIIGRLIRIVTAILKLPTIITNLIQFQQHVYQEIYHMKERENESLTRIVKKFQRDNIREHQIYRHFDNIEKYFDNKFYSIEKELRDKSREEIILKINGIVKDLDKLEEEVLKINR